MNGKKECVVCHCPVKEEDPEKEERSAIARRSLSDTRNPQQEQSYQKQKRKQ